MNQIDIQFYKTNIGELLLGSFEGQLCLVDLQNGKNKKTFESRLKKKLNAEFVEKDNALLNQTKIELTEYFDGNRKAFTLPLLMVGTDFQKKVWQSLLKVPYGTTSSYLQIAKDIENEKAVRAVANANGANPISFIIPCHRVIGSNGQLVGYGGGLALKEHLLDLENQSLNHSG